MTRHFVFAVSVMAALAAPAFAVADPAQPDASAMQAPAAAAPVNATPAPAASQTASSEAPDLDRIECRSSPPPTGTRLGATRECHTIRQWNERQQEEQRTLTRMQSVGVKGSGG